MTIDNGLLIQVVERSSTEVLFSSIQYVFTLICLIMAILVMVLVPVVLAYSIVVNYSNLKGINSKLTKRSLNEDCADNSENEQLRGIACYKSYKNFVSSAFGLAAWNIFSLLYISTGFENFRSGVYEYFYFPFKAFGAISHNNLLNSVWNFQSNWLNMLLIILLTLVFYGIANFVVTLRMKALNESAA